MPIFTLDTSPEITEVDGKFTVSISDELAKTSEDYNTLNTQLSTANNSIESFKGQIGAYGETKPEDITTMQSALEAYKKTGNPGQLKLDLATASQANKTFQETIEGLNGKVDSLSGFKNQTVIGGKINAEMVEILGDSAGQYKEVYKNWINELSLNSEGVPVTKEGFTVKQFIANKIKEPGYSFMKRPSTPGMSTTPGGGGGGTELQQLQSRFDALGKETQNGKVLSDRMEIAEKIKALQNKK